MPIGRFARCCRLTVKALRHYDELGLLQPRHVDPNTGYRFYERGQVRTAVSISMLRSLDVPLPEIRRVLGANASDVAAALDAQRSRIARELVRKQQILASLERLVTTGDLMPYTVSVHDEPAKVVARLDVETTLDRQEADTTDGVRQLLGNLTRADVAWSDPVECWFLRSDDKGMNLALCAELADARPALPEPLVLETVEPGAYAVVRHVGPYGQLGLAHHALLAWVRERGLDERGVLVERYLNDPADVAEDALITEVRLPVKSPE